MNTSGGGGGEGVVVRFRGWLVALTASVDIDILMFNWHGTVCHHLVIHSIFGFPYRVMPINIFSEYYLQNLNYKKSLSSSSHYTEGSDEEIKRKI